jgi:hypothetical protein
MTVLGSIPTIIRDAQRQHPKSSGGGAPTSADYWELLREESDNKSDEMGESEEASMQSVILASSLTRLIPRNGHSRSLYPYHPRPGIGHDGEPRVRSTPDIPMQRPEENNLRSEVNQ